MFSSFVSLVTKRGTSTIQKDEDRHALPRNYNVYKFNDPFKAAQSSNLLHDLADARTPSL